MLDKNIIMSLLNKVDKMAVREQCRKAIYLYGDTVACINGYTSTCSTMNTCTTPDLLHYELYTQLNNIDVYVQTDDALLAFYCTHVEYNEECINVINTLMERHKYNINDIDSVVLEIYPKGAGATYKDLLGLFTLQEVG